MPAYQVHLTRTAEDFLDDLRDRVLWKRLMAAIEKLGANPFPPGSVKMSGLPFHRVRVGDYRIIYRVEGAVLTVTVVKIGHRREIYRE